MKKLAMSLAVVMGSISASAQTSTTVPAPTSGTTTAPAEAVKPAAAKKWSASAYTDMAASENDARANTGGAKVESLNQIAVSYKVTDSTSVGLLQEFAYNHLSANTAQNKLGNEVNRVDLFSPAVRVSTKTAGILGSKGLSPSLRYYVPVSYERRAVSGYYGSFRGDVQPAWELSTKTTASIYISPRGTFAPRDNVWTDVSGKFKYVAPNLRLIVGPDLAYSFNDNLGVNTYAFVDQIFDYNNSMNFSRARTANSIDKNDFTMTESLLRNNFHLGAGVAYSQKFGADPSAVSVTVNPYIEKVGGLNERFENPTQNFEEFLSVHDNMTYNLFLSVAL
jgi:hypothetical protein